MGKEKFIKFTKELAELYIKVEDCYKTINDFQKEIGFKKAKSDQFEISNLVYIIGNDILEECNLVDFYERHKFKFKKKLAPDFLLYIKMRNTVYMMHNKSSSLGFLKKIWDKISEVDAEIITHSAKRDFMETTQLFKKFMMLYKIIFHSKIAQLRKINVFAIVREHSINFEIIKF